MTKQRTLDPFAALKKLLDAMSNFQALLNKANAIMKGVAASETSREKTSQITEVRFAPDNEAALEKMFNASFGEDVQCHVQLPGASQQEKKPMGSWRTIWWTKATSESLNLQKRIRKSK